MSKPFDQGAVDEVRTAVLMQLLVSAVRAEVRKPPVRHLWFPRASTRAYDLRDGNPPSDTDRPKHLRGLRLELDLGELPPSLVEQVNALIVQRQKQDQDVKKSFFDYPEARKMLEQMRAPKRLVKLPWDGA